MLALSSVLTNSSSFNHITVCAPPEIPETPAAFFHLDLCWLLYKTGYLCLFSAVLLKGSIVDSTGMNQLKVVFLRSFLHSNMTLIFYFHFHSNEDVICGSFKYVGFPNLCYAAVRGPFVLVSCAHQVVSHV